MSLANEVKHLTDCALASSSHMTTFEVVHYNNFKAPRTDAIDHHQDIHVHAADLMTHDKEVPVSDMEVSYVCVYIFRWGQVRSRVHPSPSF